MISGAIITQTFSLSAGWNTIYLGVEPVNTSALVNEGTEAQPLWVHERSVMEAVFAGLAESGRRSRACGPTTSRCSNKDYIIDPSEGLWDEPGWERYLPDENVGPDDESRGFLTTFHSLHANTGYLVKLADTLVRPGVIAGVGQARHRPSPLGP